MQAEATPSRGRGRAEEIHALAKQGRAALQGLLAASAPGAQDKAKAPRRAAAVTLLLRLVFLLYGEDCALLPPTARRLQPLFSGLQRTARRQPRGMARGFVAWGQLRDLFDSLASGGPGLFAPCPNLQQWPALSDAALYAVLHDLLHVDGQRLHYRTLDVEQLGGVYEGLLDCSERRRTSSHYTPRGMTQPIVQRALQPVLRSLGPQPSSAALLRLKVCDPAMGSGAFLLPACRILAEHLLAAWAREPQHRQLLAGDPAAALARACQQVAQHCLYGVDKNPAAVHLAKLSLWALTPGGSLPFDFMDHALKIGDSLLGLDVAQLRGFDWTPDPAPLPRVAQAVDAAMAQAAAHALDAGLPQEAAQAAALLPVRILGDLALGCFFAERTHRARRARRAALLPQVLAWLQQGAGPLPPPLAHALQQARQAAALFHWPVEFPTAHVRGMTCMLGNPPFVAGRAISGSLGYAYFDWLPVLHPGAHGNADTSAHFLRRAYGLLGSSGSVGMVATNTIGQGDTRQTGLQALVHAGAKLYAAERHRPWESDAAVTVSVVHLAKGAAAQHTGPCSLDGQEVSAIASTLHAGAERRPACDLPSNAALSFQGSVVLGKGFILTPAERSQLLAQDPHNAARIHPYLGGEELNTSPTQAFARYVIDFRGASLQEASTWPGLLAKLRQDVYPERQLKKRQAHAKNWWRHGDHRPGLYAAIRRLRQCLAISSVTKHVCFAFQPTDRIFSHALVVVALDTYTAFSILQSRVHDTWATALCSTMGSTLRYVPTDCFRNFPFPADPRGVDPALEALGAQYHAARTAYMRSTGRGLTKAYNAMQDPSCVDAAVLQLRGLQEALDGAVLRAYGWGDLRVPPYCPLISAHRVQRDEFREALLDRLFALNVSRFTLWLAKN